MRLPTQEEFDAIRFVVWNIFEILLMVLAMIAVVGISFRHIRGPRRRRARLR